MLRFLVAAALAAFTLVSAAVGPARAASTRAPACWGPVSVTPGRTAVGGTLVLQGRHYACSGPAGFLPRITAVLYQPHYGFALFTVHTQRNGHFRRQITIPARMRAMADINAGGNRMVDTRPGRYYVWMTLFDVSVVPPAKAVASFALVPGKAPSATQIKRIMGRTVEVADHRVHFIPARQPITIPDGRGTGALTAVVGTRFPAAGGTGQLTFFWFNQRFVGRDSSFETGRVLELAAPAPGTFRITYAHYGAHDRPCCPSLQPVTVQSGWSGTMLIANGIPPRLPGKVGVTLLPAS